MPWHCKSMLHHNRTHTGLHHTCPIEVLTRCAIEHSYNSLLTNLLFSSPRFPASPPSVKWLSFFLYPPRGEDSLNGQQKLEASLKAGPQVYSSWTRSSIQMMLCLPRPVSMIELSVMATRCFFTLPKPRLYRSARVVEREGYPYVMNGSTRRSMVMVAEFNFTKTAL
jgi:hypothetical protein